MKDRLQKSLIRTSRKIESFNQNSPIKLIGLEDVSFIGGMIFEGAGRLTGFDGLSAVPFSVDLLWGAFGPRKIWEYVKYGAGVSVIYSDKWLPGVMENFQEMYHLL
ncbi:MAG: hypothetical protein KKF68_02650 [Nanoarchaeota archaeon]|nr:hypothetical protein [Nanoarchaeota archaeon]